MACSTGEACGLTETWSLASRWANQSAVMMLAIEALDAWWPPTLTPVGFGRTRFAWCTMAIASQSTRRSTRCSTSRSTEASEAVRRVAIDMRASLLAAPAGIRRVRHHGAGHAPAAAPAHVSEPPRPGGRGRRRRPGRDHDPAGVRVLPQPPERAADGRRLLAGARRAAPGLAGGGARLAARAGAGRAAALLAPDRGARAGRRPERGRHRRRRPRNRPGPGAAAGRPGRRHPRAGGGGRRHRQRRKAAAGGDPARAAGDHLGRPAAAAEAGGAAGGQRVHAWLPGRVAAGGQRCAGGRAGLGQGASRRALLAARGAPGGGGQGRARPGGPRRSGPCRAGVDRAAVAQEPPKSPAVRRMPERTSGPPSAWIVTSTDAYGPPPGSGRRRTTSGLLVRKAPSGWKSVAPRRSSHTW